MKPKEIELFEKGKEINEGECFVARVSSVEGRRKVTLVKIPTKDDAKLLSSWCGDDCTNSGDNSIYASDNSCEWGVGKHHYHCSDCGGLTQIG